MTTKRAALKRIQETVDDRFKDESPEFRDRLLHWLDTIDADMDSGVFDVQLAIAVYTAMARQETQQHAQDLEKFVSSVNRALDRSSRIYNEMENAGQHFSKSTELARTLREQHNKTSQLAHTLNSIQTSVDNSYLRAKNLQPKIDWVMTIGSFAAACLLCLPFGIWMGWDMGRELYRQRRPVVVGEYLWYHNTSALEKCMEARPEPCSVNLVTGEEN